MGRRGGRKGGRGGGGNRGGNRQDWSTVEKVNAKFEDYYNTLNIVPEGEEREQFWAALRRDLPNSFRFTGSKGHALKVQERLKDFYIPKITEIRHEGNFVEPPKPVEWYPDQLAWSMTTPKNVIRRFAPFASFQKFLVAETEVGNISRQEIVSMIPPLLMDLKPGHTVLDMCAAPGSKSCQLIEMLHSGEEERMKKFAQVFKETGEAPPSDDGEYADDGRTSGLMIANDSDYRRAHMLIHQMKRLNSPNLIVTNHDATMYPSIKLPSPPVVPGEKPKGRYLKFDRILADVPCSGDGTARKNVNVWKDWNPTNGLGLYVTQVRILVRALQMLKVGGRVVYSTCSLNPIENEAVVAAAIERCGGTSKVKVIDSSDRLPALKRVAGLKEWKIMDRQGRWWGSWAEVQEHIEKNGSDDALRRIVEGMFAPKEDAPALEHCMRVYPHQQDTGGFFITVLEKQSEIKAKSENESKKTAPKPAVSSLIEELDARQADGNGKDVDEKLESLDTLMPVANAESQITDRSEASQFTNRAGISDESMPTTKRTLEDDGAAASAVIAVEEQASKRQKLEEDGDKMPDAFPEGDRTVHYPPPPAAQLELTAAPSGTSTPQNGTAAANPAPQKKKANQPIEESFKYLDPAHSDLDRIWSFYEVSPRFPRTRFMVRNAAGTATKTIYYTSSLARDILIENEGKGIKFVHCGVKMFVKQDVQREDTCPWRVQTDGLNLLEPWTGQGRRVVLTKSETLRKLLIEMFPKVEPDGWKSLGEIGERVRDVGMGCCVLNIVASEDEDGLSESMTLPLWRSLYSLNLMLPKEDRKAMLLRIFDDTTELINVNTQKPPVKPQTAHTDAGIIPAAEDDMEIENGDVDETTTRTEEEVIRDESRALAELEDEAAKDQQAFVKNGDEEDVANTTV